MNQTGQLTKAVIGFLTMIGFHAVENKTVGVWDEKRKTYRSNHNKVKGAPDVVAIDWHGRYVGIEVKAGKDRLSADQTIFFAETIGRNGVYLIVGSIQDLIDGLMFFGYNLNSNGHVRSKEKFENWTSRANLEGYKFPNANKLKALDQLEKARISIANSSEQLKTMLARVLQDRSLVERVYYL